MTANVFVDTNVLIYAIDQADLKKQSAAQTWRAWLWETNRGRISFQVLQEFYVIARRKQPSANVEIRKEVSDLMAWQPIALDSSVITLAWKIEDRYGISFWDALICDPSPNVPPIFSSSGWLLSGRSRCIWPLLRRLFPRLYRLLKSVLARTVSAPLL